MMIQQQVFVLNNMFILLDALCVLFAGYAAAAVQRVLSKGAWTIDIVPFVSAVWVMVCLTNYLIGTFGLYSDRRFKSLFRYLWSLFRAMLLSSAILCTGIFVVMQYEMSRQFLLIFCCLCFVLIACQRLLVRAYFEQVAQKSVNARKILIVGSFDRGKIVTQILEKQLSWGHEVIGRLAVEDDNTLVENTIGMVTDLPEILRKRAVDEVIFALDPGCGVDLTQYLAICREMGIPARILPAMWHPGDKFISVERTQGVPFLTIGTPGFNATGLLYKRMLDIIGGIVGMLLFCIIYPFAAVAIKLDSPGPVLFRQKRIGLNGRPFVLYKFRSMCNDAEERKNELMAQNEMEGAIFKVYQDSRITKVGRWLRKTSVDEFPQFLNVIKGEMSLVGTRPPVESEVNEYQTRHLKRISIKPGITGLWQVSGRNEIKDFDKIVDLDCMYIDDWTFIDDIRILLKTIFVILKRKGAQ